MAWGNDCDQFTNFISNATLWLRVILFARSSAGIGGDFSYVPRGNSIYIYAIIINDDVGNLATNSNLASGSGLRRLVNGDFYSSIASKICLRKSSLSLAI